jgi:DNA-binding NtrC family response regulator
VESILFGHEKGAFTGATERHVGKFAEADGGVLFLDEVGELPPAAQVKLLRAIQENEIEPVGGRKPVKVDVRLISATNRNLMADVKSGRFREDLFYRLHVFPITVPPLRERTEDIPDLVRHFLARFCAEEGKRIQFVGNEALALLKNHPWPGNVRQLENMVFRAVVLAEGDTLGAEEFPQIAAQALRPGGEPVADAPQAPSITADMASFAPGIPAWAVTVPVRSRPHGLLPVFDAEGHIRALEDIESEVIRFAINHYRGQMSEVARRLHIGRSTLYRKLENLGLGGENPDSDGEAVSSG